MASPNPALSDQSTPKSLIHIVLSERAGCSDPNQNQCQAEPADRLTILVQERGKRKR